MLGIARWFGLTISRQWEEEDLEDCIATTKRQGAPPAKNQGRARPEKATRPAV
jgi:hypothetical protein